MWIKLQSVMRRVPCRTNYSMVLAGLLPQQQTQCFKKRIFQMTSPKTWRSSLFVFCFSLTQCYQCCKSILRRGTTPGCLARCEFLSAERTNRILGASASGPRLVWNKKRGIKIDTVRSSKPQCLNYLVALVFLIPLQKRQKNEAGVFAKHQKTVYKLIVFTDTISYRFSHWGATRILEAVAMYLATAIGAIFTPRNVMK